MTSEAKYYHDSRDSSSIMRKSNNFKDTMPTKLIIIVGLIILSAVVIELKYTIDYNVDVSVLQMPNVRSMLEDIKHSIQPKQHKDLFPLDNYDIIGTILVGVGLMIAASGGVGGGGILVPLLIIVYGFHPKYAIPLSNFTILGSSITNMVLNLPKRHPDADRPLVNWDLILVMEPVTMAGAVSSYALFLFMNDSMF